MGKSIDAIIRKHLRKRDELMRQVRQIDVELEALQTASDNIGAATVVRGNFAKIKRIKPEASNV